MFVHQLVLVLAVAALAAAAWWPARRIATGLAETLLVAAALAAAGAVTWTLALGLAGLAGSTPALALGPVLACVGQAAWNRAGRPRGAAAERSLAPGGPYPPTSFHSPPAPVWREAWGALTSPERIAAGAAVGLLAGAIVEVALQPGFGTDAVAYHLPTVLGWLHSGHAGSAQTLTYDFPVGYYPLTTEVLLTWMMGLSRSFAPLAGVGPFTAALGALGLWRMLGALGVSRLQRWLATAAFVALPTVLFGVNTTGPGTDLSAVSWLLCGAGIAAGAAAADAAPAGAGEAPPGAAPAPGRAILLVPAMVACGLGVGTKTTVAPLAIIVLLLAAWRLRAGLRPAAVPLAGGVALALAVAVPWYLRNWIVNGWPLWPFSHGPVGHRMPHTMKLLADSFLSRPKVSFDHSPGLYLRSLGGGTLLIAGALAAPLIARRQTVLVAAVVAVIALYAWAQAPFTGLAPDPLLDGLAITTVRYILSALVACLVAISLVARPGGPRLAPGGAALVTLATVVWSLVADVQLGYPAIPRPAWPLALALAGAALAALAVGAAGRGRSFRPRPPLALALGILALLLTAVLTSLAAPDWLGREARDGDANAAVTAFMLSRPGFSDSSAPIAFAPAELSTLAGPQLTHPLELIPADETCAATIQRLAHEWIVLRPQLMATGILTSFRAPSCLAGVRPVYNDGTTVVYAPRPDGS